MDAPQISLQLDRDVCLYRLFEAQAVATPSRDALVFKDHRLSYGELNAKANQIAHYLIRKGIGPESIVAIHVDRSIDMVIAILAVHKSGGAYIPLDPDLPIDRLLYMVEDSNAAVVLAHRSLSNNIAKIAPDIDALYLDDDKPHWSEHESHNPEPTAHTGNLAYVLYTSGSTGKPKGVMIEHSQLIHYTHAAIERLGISTPLSYAMVQPFTVDSSVTVVQSSLVTGGVLHILPKDITLDPDAFEHYCAQHTIDCLKIAPSHLSALLPRSVLPGKLLILGGEALKWSLVDRLDFSGGMTLSNHYGPTETTVGVLTYKVEPLNTFDTDSGSVPIGKPLANTEAYILDEQLNPVPTGDIGELFIGGPLVARGYLNLPEQTLASFIQDPLDPGRRLYKTGDQVRFLDSGDIEYMGRADKQLKVRGLRVEPGEIEQLILNDERVRDVVVSGVRNPEDQTELVAYYVANGQAALGETLTDQLRQSVHDALPAYMVPTHWLVLDALPRSIHGKLNLSALPVPNFKRTSSAGYIAPKTDLEVNIAELWATELGVQRVGLKDNFFELGGHSLTLMKVMVQMRQLGLNINAHTLYLAPTIAELISEQHKSADIVQVPTNNIPAQCNEITPDMLSLVQLTQNDVDTIVSSVCGAAGNIQDIYPLTHLQEGFLFHRLISPDNDPYIAIWQYAFDTRDRLGEYLDAMQQVVDRHDILRTEFIWEQLTSPVQVVLRQASLRIDEVDTVALGGDVAQALLHDLDEHYYQLDIGTAPAMRMLIAHDVSNKQWILQVITHHLIGDQMTTVSQEREIRTLLSGDHASLPAPVPFRNFVAQSRHSIESSDYKSYFTEQLGSFTEPTAPYAMADIPSESIKQCQSTHIIDAVLSTQLRKVCQSLGVTPATLFHVAWANVLAALSGTDDVVFGTMMIGRMQGNNASDQILGPCINTLPIRIRLGETSVHNAISQTHRTLAQLMALEHAPLAETQRCSAVAAPSPLFNTLLNYRHAIDSADTDDDAVVDPFRAFRGLEGRTFLGNHRHDNYPISADIDDIGDGFCVCIKVQPSLNPARINNYLCQAIDQLVKAMDTTPESPATNINVLPEHEQQLLVSDWNDTVADYPAHRTMIELFADQVIREPHAIAVEDHSGQQLDYLTLDQRANRLARYLINTGMTGPGTSGRIGIYLERNVDMLVALLAVLKAGACYIPMDPLFPRSRLSMMADDARLSCVITQLDLVDSVPGESAHPVLMDDLKGTISILSHDPLPSPDPEAPAYIIYTSGSTGKPKGVSVSHRNLVNFLSSMQQAPGINASDRLLAVTTLSFDIAMLELYLPLISGARVVLASREEAIDPQLLMDRLIEADATMMQATPATWRNLLSGGWRGKKGLKILCGGEALSHDLANDLLETGAELWNLYGPTETTIWSTVAQIHADAAYISVGSPIANTRIYIVDNDLKLLPVGVVGEMCIAGDGVSMGYLDREDLIAEKFVADPFSSERNGLMYRTGDRARWTDDGLLQVLGRLDEQVKLRGYRIEPGEIRARLVEHESVNEAVVIIREDTPGNAQLAAYLVPTNPATDADLTDGLDIKTLRDTLRQTLPEYMVPSVWINLPALPLTPNGKVDRKQLPAPSNVQAAAAHYAAPSTELQKRIARNWAEVLGVERVGVTDSFFDLGGHSLNAVKLIVKMEREHGVKVPLIRIFQGATVKDICAAEASTETKYALSVQLKCRLITRPGSSNPLFMVGSNPSYGIAALQLGDNQPAYQLDAYALQHNLLLNKEKALRSIEALAEVFVHDIHRVQPRGPYFISGGCEGAVLAYEIARQLEVQGEDVVQVIVWGVPAPGKGIREAFADSSLRRLWWQFQSIRAKGSISKLGIKAYRELIRHEYIEYTLFSAMLKYQPESTLNTNARVVILKDSETNNSDATRGWSKYFAGKVSIDVLPGTHDNWLTRYPAKFGQYLRNQLEQSTVRTK